jgi:asparagine synthase (glutamine-hydrolysing)
MCGIAGAFFSASAKSDLEPRLRAAIRALSHRGPDDCGAETCQVANGVLALGHTRLAIIDLSPGGHQPMHGANGRYTLVFNGEIYNYLELRQELRASGCAFATDSDTEVLLACWARWGAECLPRLRGMFAFAVFDKAASTLTCVRDAFGIKPLFYQLDGTNFFFASEVPALQKLTPQRPTLNVQTAYDYLVFGTYDDGADTFFKGVQQLPPGHVLVVDLTETALPAVRQWWRPSIEERRDLTFDSAAEQLRQLFLDNVRLHLRSDVPLGVALSGGLDSSAVVCAVRHIEPELPIHTFSYVAQGAAEVNEEKWADLVNSQVGAIAHKVVVSPEEMISDLDDMIQAQGEPFGSTSIYAQYRVFRLAREHGITVTLDGQGADELLAGYNGYPHARMRSLIERGQLLALLEFVRGWSQWPDRSLKQGIRTCLGQALPNVLRRHMREMRSTPLPNWLDIPALRSQGVVLNSADSRSEVDGSGRRLVSALRQALTGDGLNALLRHGDRNAMRWSIESRVPFLTTDMAEFLLSLPEDYLISQGGETKRIFRAAMRGILPDVVRERRDKIGFATPEQAWLRALGSSTMDWTEAAHQIPFIRADQLRKELWSKIHGQSTFSFQSWRMLNFCQWVKMTDPVMP